jgi:hypothetical protein
VTEIGQDAGNQFANWSVRLCDKDLRHGRL